MGLLAPGHGGARRDLCLEFGVTRSPAFVREPSQGGESIVWGDRVLFVLLVSEGPFTNHRRCAQGLIGRSKHPRTTSQQLSAERQDGFLGVCCDPLLLNFPHANRFDGRSLVRRFATARRQARDKGEEAVTRLPSKPVPSKPGPE